MVSAMALSLGLATLGLATSTTGCGQGAGIQCEQGEPVGDLGIDGVRCDCTVSSRGESRSWTFRGEPEVMAVDPAGPAAGRLETGDVIVALDGVAITTPEAGRRFANLPPEETVRLTVRRGEDERTVEVTTAAICPDDARGLEHRAPEVRGSSAAFPADPDAPLPPVPPLPPSMPTGWLGIGLQCRHCGWEQEPGSPVVWEFQSPPLVYRVDADGPAARAGIRDGDTLLMIGGLALTTVEGGTRFGGVQAGDEVELTMGRPGGRETVTVTARRSPDAISTPAVPGTPDAPAAPGAPAPPTARAPRSPRYVGSVGNARVEVLGSGSVIVNVPDPGREVEILTGDATIRVRAPEAPDR